MNWGNPNSCGGFGERESEPTRIVSFDIFWFGFFCFINISTFNELFNTKAIFAEDSQWYYLIQSCELRGFIMLSMTIRNEFKWKKYLLLAKNIKDEFANTFTFRLIPSEKIWKLMKYHLFSSQDQNLFA